MERTDASTVLANQSTFATTDSISGCSVTLDTSRGVALSFDVSQQLSHPDVVPGLHECARNSLSIAPSVLD